MTTHASGRQTVELRTATEQHIEALVALVGFHGLNPARLRQRFETDLSEDESHVVVAMAGGDLVGYGRCAWYFTNARNLVSLALHAKLGFIEVTRDFVYPRVSFDGGVGVLGRALRPTDSPY